ncbi:MAG: hypothetical protein IT434_01195, partial [Phycisphaerales bacterium]|nr:hypothetical protein [Phycisphaerales bacterium]
LEDDLVAGGAGVDQARGDDGERAGLFAVASGAEEELGDLEGAVIEIIPAAWFEALASLVAARRRCG